jgi:two-component system, chemotaxis family, protein-glutamate methylesterase/glutaminase
MGTRVLVVDDTVLYRRLVSDALQSLPDVEVVGSASNGRLALGRIAALKPDLVTLDIEMPEMNGLEVLDALAGVEYQPGVIVLSALTRRGGEMTVRALEKGAFDFINKPQDGSPDENRERLKTRLAPMLRAFEARRSIRTMMRARPPRPADHTPPPAAGTPRTAAGVPRPEPAPPPTERAGARSAGAAQMVLIGVSTGGPVALGRMLPELPADLGVPVFIVQHMPALFTQPLAASLAAKSAIRVKEAEDGETALPNHAYVAQGGRHMKLTPGPHDEIVIRITDDAPENHCRPAVDYLFRSAALHYPGRSVAVILTGMGADGTLGLKLLKRGGCSTIAQDAESCVVFGMPRAAIEAGLIDTVAPLDQVAAAIVRSVREAGA